MERWFVKGGYEHYFCPACRVGFVYPVPSDEQVRAYYASLDTGLSSNSSWETEPRHKRGLWRNMLSRAGGGDTSGKLLEIGCGSGHFLKLARELGWSDVEGIEPSEKAVRIARLNTDATIRGCFWESVKLSADSYGVVALFDVLEHAPDPAGLLRHAYRALQPGGALLLTVPNLRGLSLRVFGDRAHVVAPPEHLSYFSENSLTRLLNDEGYQVTWSATVDLYIKEWIPRNGDGAAPSDADGDGESGNYARWYTRLTGTSFLWCVGLVNVGLAASGLGDQLACIARKPENAEARG